MFYYKTFNYDTHMHFYFSLIQGILLLGEALKYFDIFMKHNKKQFQENIHKRPTDANSHVSNICICHPKK